MSTSHFLTWIPLVPLRVKLGWNNIGATETFGANSDHVSVYELAGLLLVSRFELYTNVAQFLGDIPSNLPLCGPSVSEVLHEKLCKITASHTKDGVMQSVTFLDGHCVRHVRRAFRHVQDSLGRHAHGEHVGRLKPGLRHALSVSPWGSEELP